MTSPIERLLKLNVDDGRFPPNSRYSSTPVTTLTTADGQEINYLRRRFVPAIQLRESEQVHVVTSGERPDHLSHNYLGDAERFWELCDLNLIERPWELTATPGTRVELPDSAPAIAATALQSINV